MNTKTATLLLASAFLFGRLPVGHAETDDWPDRTRIAVNYRVGFNVSMKVRNLALPAAANNPSVNGVSYSDGFAGVDSTGNAGGFTTFWGFQNSSQIPPDNSVLLLHRSRAGQIGSSSDDPFHGLELTFNHELGRGSHIRWGLEGNFSWAYFCTQQRAVAAANVITVDAFPLGYDPGPGPYTGPFTSGPFSPLLETTSTRLPATVSSAFDASFYGFRLGPYLDLPLNRRVMVSASFGALAKIVDGGFSYRESVRTPSGLLVSTSGRTSRTEALGGGYVSLQMIVRLAPHLNFNTGLAYEGSESYAARVGTKEASLDFSGALFLSAGMDCSF